MHSLSAFPKGETKNDFFGSFSPANRELKQPRRRGQQERHKFAYLTMKNNSFARFARAFFIFGHFADVFLFSMTRFAVGRSPFFSPLSVVRPTQIFGT